MWIFLSFCIQIGHCWQRSRRNILLHRPSWRAVHISLRHACVFFIVHICWCINSLQNYPIRLLTTTGRRCWLENRRRSAASLMVGSIIYCFGSRRVLCNTFRIFRRKSITRWNWIGHFIICEVLLSKWVIEYFSLKIRWFLTLCRPGKLQLFWLFSLIVVQQNRPSSSYRYIEITTSLAI